MNSQNQEVFKTKMRTIFYNLDIKNNICADCGKQKSMDYASINNGIIICENCAKEHQNLGYNISFLHPLGEKWDDYLFNYIKVGGNSRFLQFCKDYKLEKSDSNKKNIIKKYKSKGMIYYREILRSEVLGFDPPENINVNKAFEEEKNIPDNYPEFKKYSFVKHVDMNYLEKHFYVKKEEKKEENNIFDKIGGFFGNVKKNITLENIKDIGNISNIKDWDIVKKVKEFDFQEVKQKSADMFGYFFFGGGNKDNQDNKIINDNKENKNDKIMNDNKEEVTNIKEKDEINNIIELKDNNLDKKDEIELKNDIKNNNNNIKHIEINEDLKNKIINNVKKIKEEKEKKDLLNQENNINNIINSNEIKEKENENEKINNNLENKENNEIKNENNNINEEKKGKEKEHNEEIKEDINTQKDSENGNNIIINEENIILDTNNDFKENIEDNEEKINIKSDEIIENDNAIEEILKDNNYSNDNTKMNNEEKDELEKMLQD